MTLQRTAFIHLIFVSLLVSVFVVMQGIWQPSVAQESNPSAIPPHSAQTTKPVRAILFGIDGLRWDAPARLSLQNIQTLAAQGTSVEKAYLITPYHPTVGEYGKLHTTSFSNAVQLGGTLFITPGHKMIQESFYPQQLTAHATNSTAYASLNRGFHYTMMDRKTDADVINWAANTLQNNDIRFMRIHLQNTGEGGRQSVDTQENVPWRRNIWADGSPYTTRAREADRLLGLFVEQLKRMGKWDDTLLIVTADHGQADIGWHLVSQENSWATPLIFVGPGIARARQLAYVEHTDLAPTIADLMGVAPPSTNQGAGQVIEAVKAIQSEARSEPPQHLKRINEQIRDHLRLQGQMRVQAQDDPYLENVWMQLENSGLRSNQFYGLERFLEWYEAGDLDRLIENNQRVLQAMQQALAQSHSRR